MSFYLKNSLFLIKMFILEHVGELVIRAKIVNFLIRLGAKTGVMPLHNEDFCNDV